MPVATPDTIPVEPMVATDMVLLLQAPLTEVSLNKVDDPLHNESMPAIVPGTAL